MKGLGVSGHLISGCDFRYEKFPRAMRALGYINIYPYKTAIERRVVIAHNSLPRAIF